MNIRAKLAKATEILTSTQAVLGAMVASLGSFVMFYKELDENFEYIEANPTPAYFMGVIVVIAIGYLLFKRICNFLTNIVELLKTNNELLIKSNAMAEQLLSKKGVRNAGSKKGK